jgi:hypothetical protein
VPVNGHHLTPQIAGRPAPTHSGWLQEIQWAGLVHALVGHVLQLLSADAQWRDFGQGLEHKGALVHARVGHGQQG